MDFRRPGEHPVEDHNHHVDGTDGVMPPVHPPESFAKPKRARSDVFGTIMLSILLIATTGYAVYAYMNDQSLQSQLSDTQSKLDAADTEISALKARLEQSKVEADAEPETDDKALITSAVKAEVLAPVSSKDKKVTVNIMKQGTEFAYVSAGFEGGSGAAYILKKVDGTWTVIHSGQDKVSQADITAYGIPTEYQSGQ